MQVKSSLMPNVWDFSRAFSRNLGLLTEDEQLRLANIKVAIPGMGGVGGSHLITMVRSGISNFKIADFDTYELENFNRQYGAFIDSIGMPKIGTMEKEASRINPALNIEKYPTGINESNIDDFLDDVDIIVDGLDFFCIKARLLLYKRARELEIPVVSAGPIGFGASVICFSPHKGMSFEEYFNFTCTDDENLQLYKFGVGLTPKISYFKYFIKNSKTSIENKCGPSLALACQLCSGIATAEVIKIILGRGRIKFAPHYFRFDTYLNQYYKGYLLWGNKNPLQVLKIKLAQKLMIKKHGVSEKNSRHLQNNPAWDTQEKVYKYLVECGRLAASGDNSQHWKFKIREKEIIVAEDNQRSKFNYSVNNLAQYISYGAVAENIKMAASSIKLDTEINFMENSLNSGEIAGLRFQESEKSEDSLFRFIELRHTNRLIYNKSKVEIKKQNKLKEEAEKVKDCSLFLFDSREARQLIISLSSKADEYIWHNKGLHEDLFRWIKFKDSDEGMNLNVLGLAPHEKIIFPYLKSWTLLRILNKCGFTKLVSFKTMLQMKSSPLFAILTARDNSLKSYFEAGRAMTRFWTKANSMGLSLQPMTSSVMLLHKYLYEEETIDNAVFQEVYESYKKLLNFENNLPVMLFRIGYGPAVQYKSPRRDAEDFIN